MKKYVLVCALLSLAVIAGCGNSNTHLSSIQVTPANPSVAAGLQQQFKATGMYSNNTSQDLTASVTWSSSNMAIATIASGGLATSATAGSTTITATQSGVSGMATLQVTAPTLASIAVTPSNATIPLGTLQQFTATGTYTDGSTQDLTSTATWSSTSTMVASITSGGLATAATDGSSTIAAASGSVNGNTQLTVAAASLVSLVISGGDVTIANGTSYAFVAMGTYNDGSLHNLTNQVTWGSSNTSVATIADGRATSVGLGTSSISAALGSVSASPVTLTVSGATITSIAVGPSTTMIAPQTQEAFSAFGTFSDGSLQNITHDVTWSSSAPGVATVSDNAGSIGIVSAVGPGSTNISATLGTDTGQAPLTVSSATLSSITLTPSSTGMAVGSALELNAVGTFSDGSKQPLDAVAIWTSSAPGVATVSDGTVTAVATGTATITAQLGSVSQTAAITVEALTALVVSPANTSFAQDTSTHLTATGTLADSTTQDLTSSVIWTSSDPAVLLMSVASGSKGSAEGQTAGNSTVTAAFSGIVAVAQVTVTGATLSTIDVEPQNPTIDLGSSQVFSAHGTFSDGTTQNITSIVTWTSSEVNVAFIDTTGGASTTGTGTTTIGAALNGVSGSTTLTVQ
jgi:trimeric autotransporter adhesin